MMTIKPLSPPSRSPPALRAPFAPAGAASDAAFSATGRARGIAQMAGKDFYDPQDPDPPGKPGCRGPDCENGKCRGGLCMYVGCEGDDCDKKICSGGNCHPVGCSGDDCGTNGHCSGSDCIVAGRRGAWLQWSRLLLWSQLLLVWLRRAGLWFEPRLLRAEVPYRDLHGEKLPCTEYVEPSRLNAGGTTTTTSTARRTITACGVEATTTTTTYPDSNTITQQEGYFNAKSTGSKLWTEIRSSLTSKLSAWNEAAMSGGTKPTTTSITKPPSMTTTGSNPPNPVAADGCAIMDGTQGVCWKKCDPKTSKPVNDEYFEGDPWCWLKSGNIGAFCNKADDCPSEFEYQPSDWEHGGCAAPKPVSGGGALMDGTQGVC
ncbi:uncharacterized protein LDX57_002843 [Aspergillus melleus]|uniref:uncharacterized protein n=1 Tax=Aspergillus melleus TaxID=138277 RepID=UPI001E8D398B|nr:uncharacterized protein LDX57_002843 [Aspergillus melleus]KAH8425094.1 hypothetical protein LDX57_002843 [Aspergillus melleus]